MKLDRFTRICLDLVLILLIALLLNNLVTFPKKMYAQRANPPPQMKFKVATVEEEFERFIEEAGKGKLSTDWWEKMTAGERWTYMFNWNLRSGWSFHSSIVFDEEVILIFIR